jgi:hypothetical protein
MTIRTSRGDEKMRIRTLAAFAAGVVVALAGTAVAATSVSAIVGPDDRIHGCYLTSAGMLRVVPPGTACADGESPIAWTATGKGERGPAGPAGPAGASFAATRQLVTKAVEDIPASSSIVYITIDCPAGKKSLAVGGYPSTIAQTIAHTSLTATGGKVGMARTYATSSPWRSIGWVLCA